LAVSFLVRRLGAAEKEVLLGYLYVRNGWYYVAYKDPNGRWIREAADTDKKGHAKAFLVRREAEMFQAKVSGIPVQSDQTLEDFKKEYLEHAEAIKKPQSFHRDKASLKHILPVFGKMKLREITPGAVQRYVDKRRLSKIGQKRISAQTVCNELNVLSAMFREAVRRELVAFNPVSRVKRPKEDNTIVRYLIPDEEVRLFKALPERLKPIVIAALHTGMRKGELLNLEWADVDFDQRLILVRNTKSNRKRYIPINDVLLATLKGLGHTVEDIHVFVNKKTGDVYKDIKKAWKTAMVAANILKFRFHDLRHTFASLWSRRGSPCCP
jgi:integrase